MIPSPDGQPYWSLDVPGLSQRQAEDLQSFVKDSGVSDFATPVDPTEFLTLHIDRDTAAALLRAVDQERSERAARSGGHLVLDGLSELLADWLSRVAD